MNNNNTITVTTVNELNSYLNEYVKGQNTFAKSNYIYTRNKTNTNNEAITCEFDVDYYIVEVYDVDLHYVTNTVYFDTINEVRDYFITNYMM